MTSLTSRRYAPRAAAGDRWLDVSIAAAFVFYLVTRLWRSLYVGGGFDSTLLGHVLWRLANGFDSQTALTGGHYLSTHASPILLPFLPVFRWLPALGMPLVYGAQAASVAFVGVAAARLGRHLDLPNRVVGWLVVPALLSSGAWLSTQNEVNETTFGIGPLAMAMMSGIEGRRRAALLWAVLAASCRIELAASVLVAGLLLWVMKHSAGRGVALTGLAFVGGYVTWLFLNPYPTESIAAHFAHLGSGPSDVIAAAISDPMKVVQPVFDPRVLSAILYWLLPFAFLPVIGKPAWLIAALPMAGVAILGVWPPADAFVAHYWFGFLAAGAVAAPHAAAAFPWLRERLPVLSIASLLAGWAILIPFLPLFLTPRIDAEDRALARAVAAYEVDYVTVPASLSGWFLDTPGLAMFPRPFACAEKGVGPYTAPSRPPEIIVAPNDLGDAPPGLEGLLEHYERVASSDHFTAWLVGDGAGAASAYEPCSEETFELSLDR